MVYANVPPMPLKGVLLCWVILFGFLAFFTGPVIATYAAVFTLIACAVACGALWMISAIVARFRR